MAKSSRSSAIKKNNQNLKKKVFGPVEAARNERQSAKLLELAQQSKPLRPEMEVEEDGKSSESSEMRQATWDTLTDGAGIADAVKGTSATAKEDKTAEGVDMDVDGADTAAKSDARSNRSIERQRHATGKKIEKRHRKAKNNIVFKRHPRKPGKKGSKR